MTMHALKFGGKPEPNYVIVTAETARRWLERNTVNRGIRTHKVDQYAADMRADNWQLSNDAITFDTAGNLTNGQHRLHAVIKSGRTITFLVIRNLPVEAMRIMDSGSARTASDMLRFDGEKSTALLAASVRQAILFTDGRIYKDNKMQSVSHAQIHDFLAENPEIRTSTDLCLHLARRIDAPSSAIVTSHWIISQHNLPTLATYYFAQILDRTNEPPGSAVHAVDSRLREIRRLRQSFPTRNFVYLFIKGWNHYATGNSVRTLALAPRGQFLIPSAARWTK